jgi:hypothetical protein
MSVGVGSTGTSTVFPDANVTLSTVIPDARVTVIVPVLVERGLVSILAEEEGLGFRGLISKSARI